VSIEDQRKAVTRKAALVALLALTLLEVSALVWSAATAGYRQGILRARDVLGLLLISGAIIGQAGAVWAVVARDPRANPVRRAVLCLTVGLAAGLATFIWLATDEPRRLAAAVEALSFNLASLSAAILIAIGIGRICLAAGVTNTGSLRARGLR
jgi:hypothetical protein